MTEAGGRSSDLSPEARRKLLADMLKKRISRPRSVHPLSFGQQALWHLYQLATGSPAYNTAYAVQIVSKINPKALKSVFQKLVDRPTTLKTTYNSGSNGPCQKINNSMELAFGQIYA